MIEEMFASCRELGRELLADRLELDDQLVEASDPLPKAVLDDVLVGEMQE